MMKQQLDREIDSRYEKRERERRERGELLTRDVSNPGRFGFGSRGKAASSL